MQGAEKKGPTPAVVFAERDGRQDEGAAAVGELICGGIETGFSSQSGCKQQAGKGLCPRSPPPSLHP